ncbi:hypothetical protein D3C80_1530630 [compost metagenome]
MKTISSFSVMSTPVSAQALSMFKAFNPSLAMCIFTPSCPRVSRNCARATFESSTSSTSRPRARSSTGSSSLSRETLALYGTISARTFSTSMISTS